MSPDEREAQVRAVIDLMEAGNSERSACEAVGINRGTFRSAALRVEAADHYARGLVALAHEQIERIEEIEEKVISGEVDVQVGRLVSDNRKWFASKLLPKKYGDKLDLNHGGTVGVNVSKIESVIVDPVEQLANSEDTGAIK